MAHRLSSRSLRRLSKCHPDLQRVVTLASAILAAENPDIDFTVAETVRTLDRQKMLKDSGASTTMNSRHLLRAGDTHCHAADLIAISATMSRADAARHWPLYHVIAHAMKLAARQLGIPIEWGGDWRSFKDGPHYQLPWRDYP